MLVSRLALYHRFTGGRGGPADYHDVTPQQGVQQMSMLMSNLAISGPKQVRALPSLSPLLNCSWAEGVVQWS